MPTASGIRAGLAFIELSINNEKFTAGLHEAQRELNEFAERLKSTGESFKSFGEGILTRFEPAIEAAAHLESTLLKFDTIFGANAKSVARWGEQYATSLGKSERATLQFLAEAQNLFVPIGFDPKAAEGLSKTLVSVAGDVASLNHAADADVFHRMEKAIAGSNKALRSYGIILSDDRVAQELFNQGIDPTKATEQQKVLSRLNIILNSSKAAMGAAGAASQTYNEHLSALAAAQEKLWETIGKAVLPAAKEATDAIRGVVLQVTRWAEANQPLIASIFRIGEASVVLGTGLVAAGTALASLSFAATGVASAISGIGIAISALSNPLIGIPIAITAIVASMIDWKAVSQDVAKTFGESMDAASKALKAGELSRAFEILGATATLEAAKARAAWDRALAERIVPRPTLPLPGNENRERSASAQRVFDTLVAEADNAVINAQTELDNLIQLADIKLADAQRRTALEEKAAKASAAEQAKRELERAKAIRDAQEPQSPISDDLRKQAEAIRGMQTAQEKYNATIAQLRVLLEAHLITWDQYKAKVAEVAKDLGINRDAEEALKKEQQERAGVFRLAETAADRYKKQIDLIQRFAGELTPQGLKVAREKALATFEHEKQQEAAAGVNQDQLAKAREAAKAADDIFRKNLPRERAIFGGVKAELIFGSTKTEDLPRKQLSVAQKQLVEAERIRKAVEKKDIWAFNP
jgi:hypothetical protein